MIREMSLGTRKLVGGVVLVLAFLLIGGWLASGDFMKLMTAVLM